MKEFLFTPVVLVNEWVLVLNYRENPATWTKGIVTCVSYEMRFNQNFSESYEVWIKSRTGKQYSVTVGRDKIKPFPK